MVKGYNALRGTRVKLGSWADYLAMRDGFLQLNGNDANRSLLSNDLGAMSSRLGYRERPGNHVTGPVTGQPKSARYPLRIIGGADGASCAP